MPRKKRIQHLPAPTELPRVETGAVQFGDDWPGLFLRGDDCLALLNDIRRMAEELGGERLATLSVGTGARLAELVEVIENGVIVPRQSRKRYERAKDAAKPKKPGPA
jgi:hypothetical protein